MNPVRRNAPEAITETDLIAFHLHELSPRRAEQVRRALELDSALRAESAAIAATLAAVKDLPMTFSTAVLNRQWQVLRPSLLAYPAPAPSLPAWRLPLLAAVALAGVCCVWWLTGSGPAPSVPEYHHVDPVPGNRNSILTPQTGPSAGGGGKPRDSQRPEQKHRPPMETASVSAQEPAVALGPPAPATSGSAMTEAPIDPRPDSPPDSRPDREASSPASSRVDEAPSTSSVVAATLPAIGVGQSGTARRKTPVSAKPRSTQSMDLTLALGANVTGSRHLSIAGGSGIDTFTASSSPSVSVALHQQFHPAVGYRAALSYTRPDYTYVYKDTLSPYTTYGAVHTGILELATTYVFQGPHGKRVHTAADVGAGLLAFRPLNNSSSSVRYAPAGVLGVSADYALSSKWKVRLSYRAQVFRTQEFEYTGGGNIPVTKDLVVSHEPSIGITYRFGKK